MRSKTDMSSQSVEPFSSGSPERLEGLSAQQATATFVGIPETSATSSCGS